MGNGWTMDGQWHLSFFFMDFDGVGILIHGYQWEDPWKTIDKWGRRDAMDFHGDSSGKQTRLAGRSLTNRRVFLIGKIVEQWRIFLANHV
jgi:hypothetical protein